VKHNPFKGRRKHKYIYYLESGNPIWYHELLFSALASNFNLENAFSYNATIQILHRYKGGEKRKKKKEAF
jgi:hypothetical protein